ncbi:MAG: hypothetical protein ACFHHU_00180 [Porticoccaceae bacterium]
MNFDQNNFSGTGILIEDPITDRTDRSKEQITFKIRHNYGKTDTYFLCVAYGADAYSFYERGYHEGMLLSFSGSLKLVANDGKPYIQCNLDRISALGHYNGPNDGIPAEPDDYKQVQQPAPGPFDRFENERTTHAGNQTVQQQRGQTQERSPRNNPPQNNQTSQPRNGRAFAGVPGSGGNGYIDKGPFPTAKTLSASSQDRAPVSADPWATSGMRQAASGGF